MKKLLFLTILLVPGIAFASFDTNLKYGMSGSDVYQLQDVLQEDGCLNHSSTGYFGLLTLDAVKCFQTRNNISSTGYVGILTRTALNSIITSAVDTSTQAELQETGTTTPVAPITTTIVNQPAPQQNQLVTAVPQAPTISLGAKVCSTGLWSQLSGVDEAKYVKKVAIPLTITGSFKSGYVTRIIVGDAYGANYTFGDKNLVNGIVKVGNGATDAFNNLEVGEYTYAVKLYSTTDGASKSDEGAKVAEYTGAISVTESDCQ